MRMTQYIEEYYPLRDRVREIALDPVQMIADRDDLPYDAIQMYDNQLQKVVQLNDEEVISVVELLSFSQKEVEEMEPCDFKTIYLAYMDNVNVETYTLENIMNSSREFMNSKNKRKELLSKCTQ